MSYYIGLMSGTSLDGVDTAIVDFSKSQPVLIACHYQSFTPQQRSRLKKICFNETGDLSSLGALDAELGVVFADSINKLLIQAEISPNMINAIGSHGQTIYHAPDYSHPFSLQIGDPSRISKLTGIRVVADFRRGDIAVGGQGAPLVPAFHKAVFQSEHEHRVIVNIGGIANITLLPKTGFGQVIGFDTGPGNTLLDTWVLKHLGKVYDENSSFGRSGEPCQPLLEVMLGDNYFGRAVPKSTGQEYFSEQWLIEKINQCGERPRTADVQATLYELTARTIAEAIMTTFSTTSRILVCGGGVHNEMLMERLEANLAGHPVDSTEKFSINPDWVEATAFAWLAYCFDKKIPGNLPSVTGASRPVVLGGSYLPD